MKKSTIMHIRDSSGIFGAERVILTLGHNINQDLFNLKLLCMDRGDGRSLRLITRARSIGIEVKTVGVRGRLDLGALLKIRKTLIENSVSIIHSHDFKSDFYGLLASINLPMKIVLTAHGSTRDSILKRFYLFCDERLVYRFFDRIIAVSEGLRGDLVRKGIPLKKISIIKNCLDLGILQNENASEPTLAIPRGHRVFAVIGRLYPDKGHRYFIEAFSKVHKKHPKITGLIIGEGPTKEEIAKQVKAAELDRAIMLCGFRSDMSTVYDRVDYVIIPSLTEGLPYVLLEAMASKVPVVATRVGDIPALIDDGVTGYLVQPADSNALGKRMRDLLRYPQKAKEMSQRGHRFVMDHFSYERMVKQTQELYLSLLS
jgi:glycosyltransferase involved in cell wall biosynthesis